MPFGLVGRLSQKVRQVDGGGNRFTARGNLGGECGASLCNQRGFVA